MADGRAGRSERDVAVRRRVAETLSRQQGPLRPIPALMLLGTRGSGKTALTGHLREWARRVPLASIDLEPVGERGGTPIDVLIEMAFQLSARHDGIPRLGFPALGALLAAVGTAVDAGSRERAVRDMAEALRAGRAREHSYQELQGIVDGVAQLAGFGLPGWSSVVMPLVQGGMRMRLGLRLRRRFAETSAAGPGRGGTADFLVGVNRLYHGYPAQRAEAERVLLDSFLADLRGAYASGRADRLRTTHCLALLDNADSPVGEAFLTLLLESRERSGRPDPLLVVTTARRRPETLVRAETGSGHRPDYRESWPRQSHFRPLSAGPLVVAGQLRDLSRREVEAHAAATLDGLPAGSVLPRTDNAVQWLGWIVYEVTRGHPAGTAEVLDGLRRMPADMPWDARMHQCLAPLDGSVEPVPAVSAGPRLLELLLRDCSAQLARLMPRAAAGVTLGRAETCESLWEGQEPVLREFVGYCADDLRTVPEPDDGLPALHRLTRFLLLRRLDGAPETGGPGSWTGAHRALRAAAVTRGDLRAVAYHDLALDDLGSAVGYLRDRFDEVGADAWCADLAWLQRAPCRWDGALPEPARDRYERLVGVAGGDAPRRAITRLLAAGWITPHPRPEGAAQPYGDPLGDPYAELYPDIVEEFLTLRRPIGDEHDRHVLLRMAQRYERKPWW
ncbi:ATP-binding protein [Streptomyces sp. NPDC001822]|uniref:ATP-binding protein n=1 Tax=Streptomyces sp. NPDC001822 TaxID=3364614 RepID=UPI0036C827AA